MMHTLRERIANWDGMQGELYGNEFRRHAVGSMKACDDKSAIWCKHQAAREFNL
jgi:hypothetical protein